MSRATPVPAISFLQQTYGSAALSWQFLPYFWAPFSRWTQLLAETDSDSAFEAFLRAGAARVLVPVRQGWEQQASCFLATGQTWGSGGPQIDKSIFLSIAGQSAAPMGGTKVGDPWPVRLPTSLV